MALVYADRVKVRSRTQGTGAFTLENTVAGFQSFAVIGDANETFYGIVDVAGNWEIGRGTYTATGTTLSRDQVISSSNSNQLVDFPAGGKNVYTTIPSSLAGNIVGTILASRTSPSGSTGSISNGSTANVTVTGFKGYLLYKIQTSAAAWVRIYTSVAARTADSGRSEGVDPSPGAGVIAEVITTGAETVLITPGTIGFNDESSPTTDIELAVTNKSGGSADITVTLTVVKVEE